MPAVVGGSIADHNTGRVEDRVHGFLCRSFKLAIKVKCNGGRVIRNSNMVPLVVIQYRCAKSISIPTDE